MDDRKCDPSFDKSTGGLIRIARAFKHSVDGLCAAAKHERAFRQELFVFVPLSVAAWFLPVPIVHRALLFAVAVAVLIVELLNSAIEANTDHISLEHHPLAKRAKDIGSAAVLLALIVCTAVWIAVLWKRFV